MRPRIVAGVSCYREGSLIESAIRSASMLDGILIAEGPLGEGDGLGSPSVFPPGTTDHLYRGKWESDADKRTWMIGKIRELWPGPVWVLWLDGDEVLLYGEYLHDWLGRVLEGDDPDNPIGGWPFSLVELDGTVSICMGKLVRADLIRQYLASSSYLEMTNGDRRTVGNVPYFTWQHGPLFQHWRARPPLHGEPHLQHRPLLREKGRTVERQHVAEERAFREIALPESGPIPRGPLNGS